MIVAAVRLSVPVARRHAGLFHRPDPVRQPVHAAETAFLLSTPARGRPGVRLQVSGRRSPSAAGRSCCSAARSWLPTAWCTPCRGTFYVLLPLFFLGFVLLPGSLGALAMSPDRQLPAAAAQASVAVCWAACVFWPRAGGASYVLRTSAGCSKTPARTANDLTDLLGQFAFAAQSADAEPLDDARLAGRRPRRHRPDAIPLALVWSNGLFLYVSATIAAR